MTVISMIAQALAMRGTSRPIPATTSTAPMTR